MMRVLKRLGRMTGEEISWRARTAARIASDRMSACLHPPSWDRADIGRALSNDGVDAALRGAIAACRWQQVHDRLAERIRDRGARFALDPASAPAIREEVLRRWPDAAADARQRGEAILAGRYDLLGYRGLTFHDAGGPMDWHLDPVHRARAPLRFWADVPYLDPAIGDHKIIWELNRQQHWLKLGRALWMTGDGRYGQRMLDELRSWLAANPPLLGINWSSMLELGFRAMSWIWGLHFLLGAPEPQASEPDPRSPISLPTSSIPDPQSPWLIDMLVALDRQLTHIERNLSTYFSPNTHLTGEALALYVTGVALPELAGSSRWRNTGREILLQEIDRQIHHDGGHVERSTHYHRYTLDFYLMALITARRDGDAVAERRFMDASARLAEFALSVADSTGQFPVIGDDDGGMAWPFAGRPCRDVRDSLAIAAALLNKPGMAPWGIQEEACWVAAAAREMDKVEVREDLRDRPTSRLLADTGYVVARDDNGSHAVFDVGQHGFMNSGHAHADALSITLSLEGRPFLIDPGTASYTVDARLRDRFRSSVSHNTLTIDGRSQAQPSGPFQWRTRADATLHGCRLHPQLDWAEASHDAYAPIRHRRSVLRTADSGWLVVDEVLGDGAHAAAAHWHVDPGWHLCEESPGCVRALHIDGGDAWILHDAGELQLACGDSEAGLGWYAPAYGAVLPAWTARITSTQTTPFAMITWIGSSRTARPKPSLERMVSTGNSDDTAIGARVVRGDRASVFLIRPGRTASHHAPTSFDTFGYRTDAHVCHCVEERGILARLDLIDVAHVRTPQDGIKLDSSQRVQELHVSLQGSVLDLQTSQPPSELLLHGSLMRGVSSIRLNQRERLRRETTYADTLCVLAADWAERVRDLLPSLA